MANEILNIIEDYERWLQTELLGNEVDKFSNGLQILETGGTNFDIYNKIIDDIETSLNYAVKVKDKDNNKGLVLKNILTDNTFLYHPDLDIIFDNKSPYNAKINIDNAQYDVEHDALKDIKITYWEEEINYPNVNIGNFKKKMWHELHHTYVVYQVKKEEYENGQINLKKANERNLYSDFQNNETIKDALKQTYYYTNIEEINSHLNEMIPYLKEHEEINFTNYQKFLNEIPGYDVINILRRGLKSLEIIEKSGNVNVMNIIGNEVISVYNKQNFYQNKKLGTIQAFNFIIKRLNRAIIYSQKEFYKILAYTLKKLNRKQRYNEHCIMKKPFTAEDFDREWIKLMKEFDIE